MSRIRELFLDAWEALSSFVRRNVETLATVGQAFLGLWMVAVIVVAFLLPATPLGTLGQAARVIFFHIPVAWVTALAFLLSSAYSIRYLLRRRRVDDHRAVNADGLGVVFCILDSLELGPA